MSDKRLRDLEREYARMGTTVLCLPLEEANETLATLRVMALNAGNMAETNYFRGKADAYLSALLLFEKLVGDDRPPTQSIMEHHLGRLEHMRKQSALKELTPETM